MAEVNRNDVWGPDGDGGEALCQRCRFRYVFHGCLRLQQALQTFAENLVVVDQQGVKRQGRTPSVDRLHAISQKTKSSAN